MFLGKPTFLPCNTTVSATTGMEKFEITCGFRSRPMYEMTRWFAETTGQSIENEGSADGMQATVTTKDNHFVATLRINLVAPESFQPYKLSVTNSQGTDSITIKLERGKGMLSNF
ncbi:hypothetical protein NP493_1811g00013 [Ridgeia piscesae]|uniref:Uncharacterized protein n=1 Tax=Ridgeia piscesae TaxID=27915 RepID=A0AAD9JSC9_RIDPI|nr:hypothetical protein NP493_1811g00013 [Ridgeia piscesae]